MLSSPIHKFVGMSMALRTEPRGILRVDGGDLRRGVNENGSSKLPRGHRVACIQLEGRSLVETVSKRKPMRRRSRPPQSSRLSLSGGSCLRLESRLAPARRFQGSIVQDAPAEPHSPKARHAHFANRHSDIGKGGRVDGGFSG